MEEPTQESTEEEDHFHTGFDDAVVTAPSEPRVRRAYKKRDPSIPELNQLEQNALLDNLPNIEMMLQALMQACVLIRQKDQLERQVDVLSRQLHDVRIALEREQSRLAEAKATRMEYARG